MSITPTVLTRWLLLVSLVGLSACQAPAAVEPTAELTEEPAGPTGTLTVALNTTPNSLDLLQADERQGRNTSWPLYDSLIWIDEDGTRLPALAESWTVSEDGTEYTFRLRHDVTFHNGEPFNADAVVYSWTRGTTEGLAWQEKWQIAESVEKIDEFTVRVRTAEPNALFLSEVFEHWAMIPPAYVEEVGSEAFGKNPVGTGPFKFVEWTEDEIIYEANPDYWRSGLPKLAQIVFRPIPEAADRVAALQDGTVDIAPRLSATDGEALSAAENVEIVSYPVDRVYYIAFNNITTGKGTPVEDQQVRLAMNYAVNRQAIIDEVFAGASQLAVGLITPANLGYDYSLQPYAYDPDHARELLAEAGYEDGLSVGFACPSDAYLHFEEVCQRVQADLEAVGIDAELELIESGAFWDQEAAKELPPLFGDSWSETSGEALPRLIGAMGGNDAAYSAWNDAEIRGMLSEIASTVDDADRIALYTELQNMMYVDPPFIYLYILYTTEGVNTRVSGYEPRAAENFYLFEVSVTD